MVCIKQKRPEGRINKGYLAETKGLSEYLEKSHNPTVFVGFGDRHVVKTCGKLRYINNTSYTV